jgi:hypothetical protein
MEKNSKRREAIPILNSEDKSKNEFRISESK